MLPCSKWGTKRRDVARVTQLDQVVKLWCLKGLQGLPSPSYINDAMDSLTFPLSRMLAGWQGKKIERRGKEEERLSSNTKFQHAAAFTSFPWRPVLKRNMGE